MVFTLEHIEGSGWKLTSDEDIKPVCRHCLKNLKDDFFFCKKEKIFICSKCNKEPLICEIYDTKNHIHTKIMSYKIKQNNKLNMMLAIIFLKLFYVIRRT